jgi:hypothetical protein
MDDCVSEELLMESSSCFGCVRDVSARLAGEKVDTVFYGVKPAKL